ncbi:hypothetical protein Ciccas_009117 [Cichlidogyrus casuarinus]|uniref:Uncharacterized protein n=1 Tax=Cichlidogyrus casuarinus TaxID=1844966 RepID=A0ABD2PZF0_9PLAT
MSDIAICKVWLDVGKMGGFMTLKNSLACLEEEGLATHKVIIRRHVSSILGSSKGWRTGLCFSGWCKLASLMN